MDNVLIRKASPDDLEPLLQVAIRSYRDHYSDIWAPGSLERYLDYAYSKPLFREFLSDPGTGVWLAGTPDSLLGYLVFKADFLLNPEMPNGCHIKRLYMLAEATGLGIGRRLLDVAVAEARRLGKSYLWLDVMKCSPAAVAFYERAGFVIHSDKSFTLIPFRTPELSELWNMVLDLGGSMAHG